MAPTHQKLEELEQSPAHRGPAPRQAIGEVVPGQISEDVGCLARSRSVHPGFGRNARQRLRMGLLSPAMPNFFPSQPIYGPCRKGRSDQRLVRAPARLEYAECGKRDRPAADVDCRKCETVEASRVARITDLPIYQ